MATDTSTDNPLAAIESAARLVSDRVGAATVSIGRNGRGSGVVVAPDRVLTNAHNLRDRTTSVGFADGRSVQGEVLGADVHGDLVILDVDTADTTPIDWAADLPDAGSVVFAVARGTRGTRIGFGLVSGVDRAFRGPRGRRITGGLEHNAPLARGSSGGPVVDRTGALVGINTHRLGEGYYLAQLADASLHDKVDTMNAGDDVARPTLGIAVAPPEVAARLRASVGLPEAAGVLVRSVEQDSPAARADIRSGDLVIGAGGRTVSAVDELFEILDAHDPRNDLDVRIVRGAEDVSATVSFSEPSDPTDPSDRSEPSED